jgi:ribosomal protein L29
MLTIQEIRQLSQTELHKEIDNAGRELMKIKMDLESGYAKGSHKATELKKYIARCNTIITEKTTK